MKQVTDLSRYTNACKSTHILKCTPELYGLFFDNLLLNILQELVEGNAGNKISPSSLLLEVLN
jgi:hypothetical protein